LSSATGSANFKRPPDQASPTFAHISDDRTAMRSVLWIAAAVILIAMLFPYASPYILSF
jgi:hypothetical protein